MREGQSLVTILWHTNPFRGDKFEEAWVGHAAAALDYGATQWGFFRSKDDPADFTQLAVFPDKTSFDRYWYSEEMAEARAEASGLYQVPVVAQWQRVIGAGEIETTETPA